MKRVPQALGAFFVSALAALPAAADPPATPTTPPATPAPDPTPSPRAPGTLQDPDQVSTRYSAYSLPQGMWAFDVGALGVGGGEAFAALGAAYGVGGGVQLSMNVAHASVGLLNLSGNWHFIDTRHFDLGVRAGFWYGHGEWLWIVRGLGKNLVSKLDVISAPFALVASAPITRWLELDLQAQYTYATLFGSATDEESYFVDAEIGLRQFFAQPGVRLFVSDGTALELFAKLPIYTVVPFERLEDKTIPFSDAWMLEAGIRSRFSRGFFGAIRLHYGAVTNALYGARLNPSFNLEFRP